MAERDDTRIQQNLLERQASQANQDAQQFSTEYDNPDRAWAKCAKDGWEDEENRVKKWDEEIQVLLVFVRRARYK